MNSLMLDLETLGTSPESVVLQISAVPFKLGEVSSITNLLDGPKFNAFPTIKSQTYAKMDGDTIKWWMVQEEDARTRVFSNPMEESIGDVLKRLTSFVKLNNIEAGFCKGGNFDWPIINFHYKKNQLTNPVRYFAQYCSRTLVKILEKGSSEITDPRLIKHDALHDCIRQIVELQFVMKDYR